MTNAHVVAGIAAHRAGGRGRARRYEAQVVLFDPASTWPCLSVPGLKAPALRFSDDSAARGDPAVVAGYPEDGSLDLRAATVASRTEAQRPGHLRQHDRHPRHLRDALTGPAGNSGGPLLTTDGRVYGVVFARSITDSDTGYVLTADQLRAVL